MTSLAPLLLLTVAATASPAPFASSTSSPSSLSTVAAAVGPVPDVGAVAGHRPAASLAARATDPAPADPAATVLPGREVDARVATIAFRLATIGVARCPVPAADPGLVLQHLTQFALGDRPGMVAALGLDRGPAVIALVPGGPAARAGVRAGDVLVAVDGVPLPPEPGVAAPFEASRAHARADAVHALLARPGQRALTLRRDGGVVEVRLDPAPACASRVHLARSGQHNAYADGGRVLVTTGVVDRLANDDELAFVLAHEMAHNILGHAAVMRGGTVKRGLGRTLGRSGDVVRAAERDADALGGMLMLDAGFDPGRGAEALRRLGGTDLGIAPFAAHAPAGERIAAMRALAAARGAR